jgi:hypothetical protein
VGQDSVKTEERLPLPRLLPLLRAPPAQAVVSPALRGTVDRSAARRQSRTAPCGRCRYGRSTRSRDRPGPCRPSAGSGSVVLRRRRCGDGHQRHPP